MTTTTEATNGRKVIAQRTRNGVDVSLVWSGPAKQLTVEVLDTATDMGYELEVSGEEAYRVFDDPEAHAAALGIAMPARRPAPVIPLRPVPAAERLRRAA